MRPGEGRDGHVPPGPHRAARGWRGPRFQGAHSAHPIVAPSGADGAPGLLAAQPRLLFLASVAPASTRDVRPAVTPPEGRAQTSSTLRWAFLAPFGGASEVHPIASSIWVSLARTGWIGMPAANRTSSSVARSRGSVIATTRDQWPGSPLTTRGRTFRTRTSRSGRRRRVSRGTVLGSMRMYGTPRYFATSSRMSFSVMNPRSTTACSNEHPQRR